MVEVVLLHNTSIDFTVLIAHPASILIKCCDGRLGMSMSMRHVANQIPSKLIFFAASSILRSSSCCLRAALNC